MTISERVALLLEDRGLDAETAGRYGVTDSERLGFDVVFNYAVGDTVVARKHRRVLKSDTAPNFVMDSGGEQAFWNADVLTDETLAHVPLIVTEGELDALAAIQAGFARTVSVPNGAPGSDEREDSGRYLYASAVPAECREIILAVDSDQAGVRLLHGLGRRLGRDRCKWVRYPKGCKDLADALRLYGPRGVVKSLDTARWLDMPGLYRLFELPPLPEAPPHEVGIPGLEKHYRARLGDFTVVTGVPSMGKSAFVQAIACHMALRHKWPAVIASFETRPQVELRRVLRTWYKGCLEIAMTPEDIVDADRWINEWFSFVVPTLEEDADLLWIMERMRAAVTRYGAKLVIIDPWNELEHDPPSDRTRTEYTGDCIRQLKRFAMANMVHVIVVAHPAKLYRDKSSGEMPVPTMYDIADCYSDDTEVLTRRGWLHHSQITLADEIAAFEMESSTLAWQQPSRIVNQHYDGEMYRFRGYGFDLLVTPNHRMVVKPAWERPNGRQEISGIGRWPRWEDGEWQIAYAKDLPRSNKFKIPHAAPMADLGSEPGRLIFGAESYDATTFCRFLGWYLAEGWSSATGVWLCQAVGELAIEMRGTLQQLGFRGNEAVQEYPDRPWCQPTARWYVGRREAPELVDWMKANCGAGCDNKRVPAMVFELSHRLKRVVLEAFIDGDGHRPTRRGGYSASTTSPYLRDDFQRIAVECGIPCIYAERKSYQSHWKRAWQLNFGTPARQEIALRGYRHCTPEHYVGQIWCLTVPAGAYVTRRAGRVHIAGNSAHWANKPDVGIIVHRQGEVETLVRVAKSRYHDQIGTPGDVVVKYVWQRACYESVNNGAWQ